MEIISILICDFVFVCLLVYNFVKTSVQFLPSRNLIYLVCIIVFHKGIQKTASDHDA